MAVRTTNTHDPEQSLQKARESLATAEVQIRKAHEAERLDGKINAALAAHFFMGQAEAHYQYAQPDERTLRGVKGKFENMREMLSETIGNYDPEDEDEDEEEEEEEDEDDDDDE